MEVRFCSLVVFLLASVASLAGCSTNPTTGRSQFDSLSREEEIQLGTEAQPQLTQEFGGKVNSPELQGYMTEVGRKLAAVTEADSPSLPWEFTLLNSPVINAFALPGGKVFLSRGLADKMTSEAQLAAVLGHEIGHVTAQHTDQRITQSTLLSGGGAILGAVAGAVLGGDAQTGAQAGQTVGQVVSLSYSRDQEIEADRLGMRYMKIVKYNPAAAIEVQQILLADSGGNRPPEILSTHPASETRIEELRKRFDKYHSDTVNNPEYGMHEAEYRRRYLDVASKLPPAPAPAPPKASTGAPRSESLLAALGDPATWCSHCRAKAAPELASRLQAR
jgi:predicted Zn-dependent protease